MNIGPASKITDVIISKSNLHKLTIIKNRNISDNSIKNLSSLIYLKLNDTKITDNSIKYLTRLKYLYLCENNFITAYALINMVNLQELYFFCIIRLLQIMF